MEGESDLGVCSEATSQQLNRNRSFKSKQLVRSQAIRESTSPPRTVSPSVRSNGDNNVIDNANNAIDNVSSYSVPNVVNTSDAVKNNVITVINQNKVTNTVTRNVTRTVDRNSDESSHVDVICSDDKKIQTVEIQITAESVWDGDVCPMQRQNKQWQNKHDLLSHSPRITCVCEPQRRPISRKTLCCSKQDSGISCSDDIPDDAPDGSTHDCSSEKEDEVEEAELVIFLKETLNKNPRDRATLLNIEKDLHSLVMDPGRCVARFSGMSSYGRMLVHRAASLFRLNHYLDNHNSNAVRVTKTGTSGGRIPCTSFQQWCTAIFPPSPTKTQDTTHAKSILKRDTHSLDETGSLSRSNSRSKSLEQREKEYEKVRRRIFSSDNCNQDESQWPWLSSGPVKLLTPDSGKNKLLKVHSLETDVPCPTTRGAVSKSHSFGGYGRTKQHRILSRQGDLASSSWRLSPSSSGYKTLSLRSTDSVTPSPTGGASPEPSVSGGNPTWPPVAAVVIHPQTGRPLTNPDGSIYQFDPANPPYLYDANAFIQHQMEENIDKRRDRLEKQDSFVGRGDCDCTADDRKQCCRRVDSCQQPQQQQLETKTNIETVELQPKSPIKMAPEIQAATVPDQPTNQSQSSDTPTNQNADNNTIQNQAPYENSPYEKTLYERQPYNSGYTNNVQYKNNQFTYDKESTNQKPLQEISANHRPAKDVEVPQYIAHNNYVHSYRNDEVQSPQVLPHTFIQPDMMGGMNLQGISMHKIPILQDPNIRAIPVANMLYQPPMHQPYQYVNQCRIEQPMQPIYQPMLPTEEHKQLAPSPHPAETTFRIDPSYPYAAVDYSQCGACVDTTNLQPQHRSYNMSIGGVEVPVLPVQQACPVSNVMLPQPHLQHYPMPDVQWVPRTVSRGRPDCPCPGNGPALCPPYIIYPSVIPQPYQICQPIYQPTIEKPDQQRHNSSNRQSKRNSLNNSARTTPLQSAEVKREEDKGEKERSDSEIAAKIQQIKDQMAKLNTSRNVYVPPKREDWRRNSGNGILGSHPTQFNGRNGGNAWEEEVPLTPEATAIFNILRMRHKNNTYPDRRNPGYHQPRVSPRPHPPHPRPDLRQDKDRRRDRDERERDDTAPRQYNNVYRQMAPGTWCRRSPAPLHPGFNQPRRPYPDPRNGRR